MDFRVLGPLQAVDDGGTVIPVGRQQGRLLAGLLVSANSPVSSDRLIELLWSDDPPASARTSLQAHVSRLRRRLGLGRETAEPPPVLETGPTGYRLRIESEQVDATRFEQMVDDARAGMADDPSSALAVLDAALSLWRGPAYAEFADEPFVLAEAGRLSELRLAAVECRIDARLRLGEHPQVVAELERFVAEHQLRERASGQLMLALYRCARQADALEVYRSLRARLADELGLEPSTALRQLEGDILRQSPSLDWRGGGGDGLRHAVRGSLPLPVTSFVGRDSEVAAVSDALRRTRLLTLTGVGGVGKTRLATAVASTVVDHYADGAWLCELAPIADAAAVGEALATALGVEQQPDRTIEHSVLTALRTRRLLLILDNCEHVIDAAGRLAQDIASTCPEVTVLATSRQRLAVDGEQRWPVESLPVLGAPGPDRGAAERLFHDRAAAVDPGFADSDSDSAVTEICRRLDGVPLAIELAAARVAALGAAELSRRLGDRFRLLTAGPRTAQRHRTLAAVVDWSYDLLSEAEQTVFARLSVFAGSFRLDTAEQVCRGDGIDRADVAGLLAQLVDASLVVPDHSGGRPRFRLLETLRQYGAERLADRADATTVRRRFVDAYVEMAEAAEPHIRGSDEAHWVGVLDGELDNLRAAHQHCLANADSDRALRLCAALHYYAFFRLRSEVTSWADMTVELSGVEGHPLLAQVYGTAAEGAGNRGDLRRAAALADRGRSAVVSGAADDPLTRIRLLETHAAIALYEGRLDDCFASAEQVLVLSLPAGEHFHTAFAYLHQTLARTYAGDRATAGDLVSKAQGAADAADNPTQQSWVAYARGEALAEDDVDGALRNFEESIATADTVQNRFTAGVASVSISSLRSRHGSVQDALHSFRQVIEHWHRVNDWTHQWTTLRNLVDLFARLGEDDSAAILHGAVTHARSGAQAFGSDEDRLATTAEGLAERLGPEAFAAGVARGSTLADDEVVRFACTEINRALGRDVRG